MDEYIMRQAVLDAYEEEQRKNGPWRFETLIESVPAADVVPVVRCRECKHFNLETHECENEALYGMDMGRVIGMIIETCPECGGELMNIMLTTREV